MNETEQVFNQTIGQDSTFSAADENTMPPLRDCVKHAVETFFKHLDGQPAHGLYNLVLKEVEEPLIATVMAYTQNNQTKAALWLGLSRGTLRKKLEEYGFSGTTP